MSNCVFCKIINKKLPSYTIYEDDNILSFLDINPANNGHTLVIHKRHCANYSDLTDKEVADLAVATKKILNAIIESDVLSQGANIFTSQNEVSGQEVMHVHTHILPRHSKDKLRVGFIESHKSESSEKLSTIANKIKSYI